MYTSIKMVSPFYHKFRKMQCLIFGEVKKYIGTKLPQFRHLFPSKLGPTGA